MTLLQCQRDQAVEQLGIADALVVKQLGVHADRGKARNRIQLVENDLAAVVGDKEVYARQAAAAKCGVNADSVLTDGRKLLLGDMCRNVQTRAFVLVLGIKGVELLRRSDLADRGAAARGCRAQRTRPRDRR